MKGVSGFNEGVASSGSTSAADVVVVEKDYVGLSGAASSDPAAEEEDAEGRDERGEEEEEEEEEEEDLELGLSLGAKKLGGGGGGKAAAGVAKPWGQCCRILTAKDFHPLVPRASPRSSSTSSVSSSSAALGGGVSGGGVTVAGTKRAADSVSPDVVGPSHPPSQVVVGWPPIRAFRMNSLFNQSKDNTSQTDAAAPKKSNSNDTSMKEAKVINNDQARNGRAAVSSRFVKVNMDGDPIGRKVDLNAHPSYQTLALSLELMFHKPTMALSTSAHGVKASMLLDGSSEFALTYEDRDGDWMLVGDVPWGMFLDTVKRLRIMRTSDASGLAPRFQSSNKSCGLVRSKP